MIFQDISCNCRDHRNPVRSRLRFGAQWRDGIVKERMDMFKRNQKNLKAIKSHIRGEEYGSIAKFADEIRDWAVKMPEYFPEGSNIEPSEASPKIWEDFSGFKRAAMKNETATKKLIAAAEAGIKPLSWKVLSSSIIVQKLPPVIQIGLAACVYIVVYSFSSFLDYRPFQLQVRPKRWS